MDKVLRQPIKAKKTGTSNWPLCFLSIKSMLPFIATSGHNLYTDTDKIFLMEIQCSNKDRPDVYACFYQGQSCHKTQQ